MYTSQKAVHILATLHAVNTKYGKLYCYPSQRKIIELLEGHHDTPVAIATLNRYLAAMVEDQYIIRTRRIRKDKKLGTVFKSTLYRITVKGYVALRRLGVNVWKQIRDITTQGIKAGQAGLKALKGPVDIGTIISSMMVTGDKKKRYLVEKESPSIN